MASCTYPVHALLRIVPNSAHPCDEDTELQRLGVCGSWQPSGPQLSKIVCSLFYYSAGGSYWYAGFARPRANEAKHRETPVKVQGTGDGETDHLNSIGWGYGSCCSSSSHGSTNEVGSIIQVVQREDCTTGMSVCECDGGCRPIMAVQDVWPAHVESLLSP